MHGGCLADRNRRACQQPAAQEGPSRCAHALNAPLILYLQAVSFAKQHVLDNGPIILEMDTYRCVWFMCCIFRGASGLCARVLSGDGQRAHHSGDGYQQVRAKAFVLICEMSMRPCSHSTP